MHSAHAPTPALRPAPGASPRSGPLAAAAPAGRIGRGVGWLPWVVAVALFMEQLDTTIVNTTIPAMAASLGTTPLALKAVSAAYIVSLAATIPLAGWVADRWGARRVFISALLLFTLSSLACALASSAAWLIAARVPQGMAAAMMMPVGRMAIVRHTPKRELLRTMNFVIVPALLGPLLGPTLGGVVVHLASWREVFLINAPVGVLAMALAWRHMPDDRAPGATPLDRLGLLYFAGGVALLSWALEVLGTGQGAWAEALWPALWPALAAAGLLAAYAWHARRTPHPLLSPLPLRWRSFRIAVIGGSVTRLGVGGMPFLLPLLYQLGLGLPAWQSGLLMMPTAAAAMLMKPLSRWLLGRWGHRRVLQLNTWGVAAAIAAFMAVGPGSPLGVIALLAFALGLGNSLQFSSLNSLSYADIDEHQASAAATIASTAQQLSMSIGLALGSIAAAAFLGQASQQQPQALLPALHHAFALLAALTALSGLCFRGLRAEDGQAVARGD